MSGGAIFFPSTLWKKTKGSLSDMLRVQVINRPVETITAAELDKKVSDVSVSVSRFSLQPSGG